MSDLLETHSKAPILYITGGPDYDEQGVLMNDECTNIDVWTEIIQQKQIYQALSQWQQQTNNDKQDEMKMDIKDIIPFRMIIHKLENLKMVHYQQKGHKGASQCKHFALLWIPTNPETGMSEKQYNDLMDAIRNSSYFCNKLNKDCVYISGPEYGQIEDLNDAKHNEQDGIFDLDELQGKCRAIVQPQLPKNKRLYIEIAVHELAKEYSAEGGDDVISVVIDEPISDISRNENVHNKTALLSKSQKKKPRRNNGAKQRYHKSFGGSINGSTGPLPNDGFDPIYDKKSGLIRERFVFALVWLHVKDKNNNNLSVLDDGDEYQNYQDDEKENLIDFELPGYTIMKKLHQQPYKHALVYNVELFNYDECWQNQDLVVDRKILWKQAFLVFIQMYLLPIFIIYPPINIILRFKPEFNLKPRYRPVMGYIEFKDLDRIEQIPYDIAALWGSCHEYKTWPKLKTFVFRLISFISASIIWLLVFIGPLLYQGKPSKVNDVDQFVFFDCFGPLIFYSLTVFTIIWWSCATRIYIWPKEHELLYFRLIVNRPIHRKVTGNHNIRRTDWAALTNISSATILTTFIYAFRKGFLELKTPNHELLSLRPVCKGRSIRSCCCTSGALINKIVITSIINIIVYFVAHNLENIEIRSWPFYISREEELYALKLSYNIVSVLLSCVFVFGFILLWETMFDRINRHLDTIKTLSNLLIRNTYSEYIKLSKSDNILSWLIMERFIKRKGMMLFSSLETPLFALGLLCVSSWGGIIYCLYEGVGQKLYNEHSIFSNSALATWVYLGIFSLYQTSRMLFWYGRKFTRETEKLQNAFKRSCKTLHIENLMEYEVNNRNTLNQKYAMKSSQYILTHSNHNEIVPKVFGIQFDKLTAKAAWGILIGATPTILKMIIDRASHSVSH